MTDFKKVAAANTIQFFNNKGFIGLGAGSTIAWVVELLHEKIKEGLSVKLITSSFSTSQLLKEKGLTEIPIAAVSEIDLYIDGCDQMDQNLNALKSGGGIHTREKLLASMAKEFILVGDEGKYVDHFNSVFPVVVDVLPEALGFVCSSIQKRFPGAVTQLRLSNNKDGAVVTDHGNYLIEIRFKDWPELSTLNSKLKNITGIVETSLFYGLAHKAIIAGKNGVRVIEKPATGIQNLN